MIIGYRNALVAEYHYVLRSRRAQQCIFVTTVERGLVQFWSSVQKARQAQEQGCKYTQVYPGELVVSEI